MKKLVLLAAGALLAAAANAQQLKVLTYNTHHCGNMKNVVDLQGIANVIKAENPDFVALQELDSVTSRTGKVFQLKELAKLSGMPYYYFGRSMAYDGGAYGTGILSKHPITASETLQIPVATGIEPRATSIITAQLPSKKKIVFASTHLDVEDDPAYRIKEAELLHNYFKQTKYPAILAGDFNATPETKEITILKTLFSDVAANAGATFPSDNPDTKLDYIFLRPIGQYKGISANVIDEKIASDHRPVSAVIKTVK
ncbi:endonuclease/exonuclease/phosphatase family protein [Chitinophaga sp. Cy-1792]|uniref:endonuclease/exonuclease/phosphatase family protein n=1 Tax=Chitinophaga sp. Cy-1792 TaxID=2608339 RepID=UPI001421C130|nr:endonuclease/exonuclease/phosphatase family protein [Chitinophaga sp. Cy-1792]NIG53512.1 endonuclease [Chitinophaga sp. Cy-1792]